MEKIFANCYLVALYGSLFYNYILYVIAKGNCERIEKDFEYGKYFKMNADNWGLTLLTAPILVNYLPDIVVLINEKLNWQLTTYKIYYLGAGPLSEVLIWLTMKLIGWKNTFIAPVHKEN